MGCDSQFDGLYDERDRKLAEIEQRGYRPTELMSTNGPFVHKTCATVTTSMDRHDEICDIEASEKPGYQPRHLRR